MHVGIPDREQHTGVGGHARDNQSLCSDVLEDQVQRRLVKR